MAFESLAHDYEFTISDFPPDWLPLTYLYDPDLPLYPTQYFHVLDPQLEAGRRPSERDRLFGFIHHVNLEGTKLTVAVVCNKDLNSATYKHYQDVLELEVKARLGLEDPVTLADVSGVLTGKLAHANRLIKELWYQVIDASFGKSLPFGRMWDPVLGLVRFVASWNSDGGRKGELIQTHSFASEFGVKIPTRAGIHVDFYLLPTFSELTDTGNPLSHFQEFATLAQAADEFRRNYCGLVTVGRHTFSSFDLKKVGAGTKLKTEVLLKIVEKASAGLRRALFENYSAFNRGPQRSLIFLMMLDDLRNKRWNPSGISAMEAGAFYTALQGSYQGPKVIELYAQQCFGSVTVLPIDNWIETFLRWPLEFNASSQKLYYTELFASTTKWGKLERLIWTAAQSRKVHASVCKEILWCVRYGASVKTATGTVRWVLRGANPYTCKICKPHIRAVCPSYTAIQDKLVSFNGPSSTAVFDVTTSKGNNSTGGQTFEGCESAAMRTKDGYSTRDRPLQFKTFPQPGHTGSEIKVKDFLTTY